LRLDLTPLPFQLMWKGNETALDEPVVTGIDGGANPTFKQGTTMLNSTDKTIKHKVGLLNLAQELGNISKACQIMGTSRDTFYR